MSLINLSYNSINWSVNCLFILRLVDLALSTNVLIVQLPYVLLQRSYISAQLRRDGYHRQPDPVLELYQVGPGLLKIHLVPDDCVRSL